MMNLRRTEVNNFKIENSVKIDELLIKKDNIISIEEYFNNNEKIVLNDRKLELFYNGVKLNCDFEDGIYRIYNLNNNFIGVGEVTQKLLKRDIIIE